MRALPAWRKAGKDTRTEGKVQKASKERRDESERHLFLELPVGAWSGVFVQPAKGTG